MTKIIYKKLLEYFLTFMFIITIIFTIPRLMPGDPFTFLSSTTSSEGVSVNFSEAQIDKYKEYYGMDKSLPEQYGIFLKNTFTGNLGYSLYYRTDVNKLISRRIIWTINLVVCSLIASVIIGTVLGCISAWKQNSVFDRVMYFIFIFISETPAFLIGILFLFIFAGQLGWFPLSGAKESFAEYPNFLYKYKDIIYHALLPIITLTFVKVGEFYLLSRNSMITVLSKKYMTTARAKGLKTSKVVFTHALRNAILPLVTRIFLSVGSLLGAAVLVENVFNYPGVGKLMKDAVMLRDYPLIQGIFVVVALMVLISNLLSDVVYKKIDPRVRNYEKN